MQGEMKGRFNSGTLANIWLKISYFLVRYHSIGRLNHTEI
jgi:hypothetical protein